MSNWLEQLERELDQRLAAFLSQNPVQEQLFRQQHQLDRARSLQRQRQQLQQDAEEQRKQLLALAADVRAGRSARSAPNAPVRRSSANALNSISTT